MLIGLNGQYGSGKDTVYERLCELAWHPAKRRLAFADPLKDSVCALFNIDRALLEVWKIDSEPFFISNDERIDDMTMRTLLQRYGTEAHRNVFGDTFWVDSTVPPTFTHDTHELVVVTDVRFPNEAERIQQVGGHVWRILGKNDSNDLHASEQILSPALIDHTIYNLVWDDNYAALDEQVTEALKMMPL